jgi:hypothetical protein
MGMSQTFEPPKVQPTHAEYQPLVDQIGGHQRIQKIGMLMLEAIKGMPLDEGESDLDTVGLGPEDVSPKEPSAINVKKIIKKAGDDSI